MAAPYFNISVGTSAVQLVQATEGTVGVFNNGSAAIYLGTDANVTTSNGFPVPAASGIAIAAVGPQLALFGISGSPAQDVRIFIGNI